MNSATRENDISPVEEERSQTVIVRESVSVHGPGGGCGSGAGCRRLVRQQVQVYFWLRVTVLRLPLCSKIIPVSQICTIWCCASCMQSTGQTCKRCLTRPRHMHSRQYYSDCFRVRSPQTSPTCLVSGDSIAPPVSLRVLLISPMLFLATQR